ncbi:MAG: RluA family pseudouridine synthase [Bacteroidales bacterium]|nr:RluA family pseudouridine synthase [Candidatus Equibacterium intestinale]
MIYRELPEEEFEDISGRILYEDNHLLVINKKVGEIVQGDNTGDEPLSETLKAFIAQRDGKQGHVFMGVPHRLDRPVSGIAMFAKTSKALERMNEAFRTSTVSKTYWALTCAAPEKEEDTLTDMLLRNEKQNKTYICHNGNPQAKEAKLRYRLLKSFDRYHLVEVELITGRHHQIRCQLAGIGCVIKGDLKYGAARSNRDGGINLHARSITFVHPTKGETITVTAPVSWPPFINE